MEHNLCIKIADEISDKLIFLCKEPEYQKKTLLEIYSELLDKKYKKYHYDILSYIPERLAVKGYEIVSSKPFQLQKY